MSTHNHQLTLRIEGPLGQSGKVPITVLSEKLLALQRVLLNIGSALVGGGRRGQWRAEVSQACGLVFVATRASDLEVIMELPASAPSLFHAEDGDLGCQTLRRLRETLQALHNGQASVVRQLYPDYGTRARVMKSAISLLPEEEADYELSVLTPQGGVKLVSELRPKLIGLTHADIAEIPDEAGRTLTGILYLIQVATGERQLGVIVSNRRIPCFYAPEYEDVVRDLIPGSLVEVEGRATLDERGQVHRIEDVVDVRPVQLVPLYWSRIVYGNRRFHLREHIQIQVDFRDGLWIHEYAPLGILAYAETRAESLNAFRMDFAACWDFLAQEGDHGLTEDARVLKAKLLSLVERIEE